MNGTDVERMDIDALVKSSHRACTVLKSMANEHRLLALCNLAEGEKSVGELQKLLPLSQSALSQHLAILRRENLVKTRKSAQVSGRKKPEAEP
jgi:DNA-binding transcriptional ArsR family regulator